MRRHPGKAARSPLLGVALGALVAIALVVSQLASLGHLALVRHVRCEHGALVHAGHEAGPTAEPRAAAEHRAAVAPGGREAEHDHCDGLALRAALVDVAPTCVVPEVLPDALAAFRVHDAPTAPVVALLHLAPKSSPPA